MTTTDTTRAAGNASGTSAATLPGPAAQARPQEAAAVAAPRPSFSGGSFGASGGSLADLKRTAREADELAQRLAAEAEQEDDPYVGMSPKERRAAQRAARRLKGSFDEYTHLLAIKPREGYVFHSDYYNLDGGAATVMGFFHDEGAQDAFGAFWGVNRIPSGLGEGVSVVLLEQVRRMGEKWIDERIKTSEKLDSMEEREQAETGTNTSRRKAAKAGADVAVATGELQDGASYLHVHNRIIVKAPSLEALDIAVEKIQRLYIDRFGTLRLAAYAGEQRKELATALAKNDKKKGSGEHFTSVEFAGAHSLVTNGLSDPSGEYVGSMLGDVNNSAVLFDVDGWDHHVVVADDAVNRHLGRAHVPDMWGSKIAQAAILNGGRAVHVVLDGAKLELLGPPLRRLTASLNMNDGDINMFEMFGKQEEELAIFPAHLDKLVLMYEQAYKGTDSDRSIIRGSLRETLTTFYIDKGMWSRNAQQERKRLRVVGVPHRHVPRMQDVVSYFDTLYRGLANATARDEEAMHAYNVLRMASKDMLDNNGAIFNTFTKDAIDGASEARRVVYDFSSIARRGIGVAMAQLINVIGFAVDSLGEKDVVIIHGAENIVDDSDVKAYLNMQFDRLFARGGRVAYLYNDVDKMLADSKFSRFDKADWTVLGHMADTTVADYQKRLGQDIPPELEKLVTQKGTGLSYLRRGVTNVVFALDLALGVNPARQARRDAIAARFDEEDRAAEAARREVAQPSGPSPVSSVGERAQKRPRTRRAAPEQRTLGIGHARRFQ